MGLWVLANPSNFHSSYYPNWISNRTRNRLWPERGVKPTWEGLRICVEVHSCSWKIFYSNTMASNRRSLLASCGHRHNLNLPESTSPIHRAPMFPIMCTIMTNCRGPRFDSRARTFSSYRATRTNKNRGGSQTTMVDGTSLRTSPKLSCGYFSPELRRRRGTSLN